MKRRLIKSLFLALAAFALMSSVALAYIYSAPYTVSNNSSTSYDMIGMIASSNNDWMANNGFMNSTGNDTRVESMGGLDYPHLLSTDRTLVATPSPANSQTNLYYVTGESELDYFQVMPGYSGNVTVADAANLEMGSDNWSILIEDGWLNTQDNDVAIAANRIPNGVGDYTNIANVFGAATHWEAVDDPPDNPDDATTYVYTVNNAQEKDAYALQNLSGLTSDATITSVTVYFRFRKATAGDGFTQPFVRLGGAETTGTEITLGFASGWETHNETLARPGGGDWTIADLDALQVAIGIRSSDANQVQCTQVYVRVAYTNLERPIINKPDAMRVIASADNVSGIVVGSPNAIVSATGISSGEYSANVSGGSLIWAKGNDLNFTGGVNSGISCGAIADNLTTFWYSFWFKPDINIGTGSFYYTWGKWTDDNNMTIIAPWTTGSLALRHRSGGVYAAIMYSSETSWAADVWQHALVDVSDNGTHMNWEMIINNGTPVTTSDATRTPIESSGNFRIGYAWGGTNNFPGEIANVCWGSDNLTSTEKVSLYYNTFPGDEIDLWYIDEGVGVTIVSYGTSPSNGTALANNTWQSETRPCKLGIEIDGTSYDGFAREYTVPNTTDNWTAYQNNSLIYSDNFSIVIDDTVELCYQPASMIEAITASTGNLTDLTNVYNHGFIYWGSNPTLVTATLGSMASASQPSLGEDIETPTVDVAQDVGVSDWFIDPDITGTLATNPIRPFVQMVSDNTTINEIQVWRLLALAVILIATVATGLNVGKHQIITGIVCGAGTGAAVALTIFPMWALVFVVGAVIGGAVAERSPSL